MNSKELPFTDKDVVCAQVVVCLTHTLRPGVRTPDHVVHGFGRFGALRRDVDLCCAAHELGVEGFDGVPWPGGVLPKADARTVHRTTVESAHPAWS